MHKSRDCPSWGMRISTQKIWERCFEHFHREATAPGKLSVYSIDPIGEAGYNMQMSKEVALLQTNKKTVFMRYSWAKQTGLANLGSSGLG